MLALAVPALSLRLGSSDAGQDPPSSTTRKAYDLLAKGFGPGFNGTFQIVAKTPNGKADLPKVQQLADALGHDQRPRGGEPAGAVAQRQDRADRGAPRHGAAGRGDQRADQDAARRRRSEGGRRPARLRRRPDRDLRRLRRGADRQAAAVHRRDRAPRLPAADDRLPQPADPAHRGGDEPARRGRGVRRRHPVFQQGFLAGPLGVGTGPVEAFLPGDDARDPVRALDGLPGLPGQPHARGVDAHRGQRRTRCGSARPRPAA